jgi:hypothetical protein
VAKKEYFECSVCGALIDPETGETRAPRGSNAESMEGLKEKVARLQTDLSRAIAANEQLREGKDEDGDDGAGDEGNENPRAGRRGLLDGILNV